MNASDDTTATDGKFEGVDPSTGDLEVDLDRDLAVDVSEGSVLEGDSEKTAVPPAIVKKRGGTIGGRLAGVVAALLGLVGCLLSFLLLAISVRLIFVASDAAETAAAPLSNGLERLDTRIDQVDDLIDRDGVSGTDFTELQARADGLADIGAAVDQAFSAIDNHVVYRWLPVDTEELGRTIEQFSTGADDVAAAANGSTLGGSAASRAAERVNNMQTAVSNVDDLVDQTVDSLTSWIRLTGLGGMILSLWSLWAQTSLMKRGWRGIRGSRVAGT